MAPRSPLERGNKGSQDEGQDIGLIGCQEERLHL